MEFHDDPMEIDEYDDPMEIDEDQVLIPATFNNNDNSSFFPDRQQETIDGDITRKNLPNLVSSFVDTFVDFCVAKTFLPKRPSPPSSQTFLPSPERLIAIGDLHGDFDKSIQALHLGGLIDSQNNWSGGSTTLVQVGDVLDRGGQELQILYLFEKLKRQAAKVGGNVITMNGNHEIMNVKGRFKNTFESGLDEFQNWADWYTIGNNMKRLCDGLEKPKDIYDGIPLTIPGVEQQKYVNGMRARFAALRRQGPIASRFLSKNMTVQIVGDSVFVHGGILPNHVAYGLERYNEEVRDWITGLRDTISSDIVSSSGNNSLLWMRRFSNGVVKDCDRIILDTVLEKIPGAKRIIVGHSIQTRGINGACNNKAIRIDVGLSKGCGDGKPEVLKITKDFGMRVLKLTKDVHIQKTREKLKMENEKSTETRVEKGSSLQKRASIQPLNLHQPESFIVTMN